ncbi:flagellar basal-body MS-ring/collar protein FliF [Seohaeicola saemankumensis]|uniref:flagellar basal-body MS-ring/collar protein FliF n=1 Tax=Seohaeicola TaxID=481178 RepID=UPI0035D064AA
MQPILNNLVALGRTRLIALGVTGVGLVLALFFGLNAVMKPTFVPLYSDLSLAGAGRVVAALEQEGFAVELGGGGSIVSVAQEDVARARMALAEQGLPGEGAPGWEIFDNASGLGMNSFMQQVSRMRALEGELARSILTIDGIDAARVHLVLPDREAFSRTRPEPSASVIVRGRTTQTIGRRQAEAIRALVASAVPDLAPSRVTVLTASGETILSEELPGEAALGAAGSAIEDRMSRSITEILTARVGAGNARVQVNVSLSSERQVIRSQTFDPQQQVVRSTESREETREDRNAAGGDLGVAGNLPAELADAGPGQQSANNSARTDEIVNYEIGSTQSETVREPGDVTRISVAVLVNGIYNVAEDGTVTYEERPAEELERLAALVRSAVGFDAERGDTVSVDSLRFIDYSLEVGAPPGMSVMEVLTANLMSILRSLFALALVAVVLIFGVTPLLRKLSAEGGLALAGPGMQGAPALAGNGAVPQVANRAPAAALSGPARTQPMAGSIDVMSPMEGKLQDDLVTLASVSGGVRRGRINVIGQLVENEPTEALRVMQNWLSEEA